MDVLHVPGPPVVGQGEGVVMEDPLGQPRGARGEVEQEGVGGQGGHPVQGVRLLGQGGQKIQETVFPRAQGEPEGDLGLLCGGPDVLRRRPLPAGDNAADLRLLHPVAEVLRGEAVVHRGQEQAQLVGRQGHDPVAPMGAQGGHHHVPFLQAVAAQEVGRLVAEGFQVPEGQALFLPPVVPPEHGQAVGVQVPQGVDDVVTVVEVLFVLVGPLGDLAGLVHGLPDKAGIEFCHVGSPYYNMV